jgi:hypothetical protein
MKPRPVRSRVLPLLLALGLPAFSAPGSATAQATPASDGRGEAASRTGATRGFEFGLRIETNFVNTDSGGRSTGVGANVSAGYNVHPRAGLHLRGAHSLMGSDRVRADGFAMGYWDLMLRVRPIARRGRLAPYLEAGWTDHTVVDEKSIYSRGPAATVGAGTEFFGSRRTGLDMGLVHTRGMIRQTRGGSAPWNPLGDDAFHVSSTRLTGGLIWRP